MSALWPTGEKTKSEECIAKLKALCTPPSSALPFELLYGHTGYLYALLFVGRHIPHSLDEDLVIHVVSTILDGGQRGSRVSDSPSPLMYTWHDKHYLGAAHGLAGILTVLLQVTCSAVCCVLVKPV